MTLYDSRPESEKASDWRYIKAVAELSAENQRLKAEIGKIKADLKTHQTNVNNKREK